VGKGLTIRGLHEVALVSRDADRAVRFYTDLLGLRAGREGSPDHYRLSFADAPDTAGAVSILEEVTVLDGQIGIGAVHHVAFIVESYDALLKWKRWLRGKDVLVAGPYNQRAYQDLVLTDPDGVLLELATRGPGWAVTQNGEDV